MSAPFVTQLRTRGDVIQMPTAGATPITIRVEMPEIWDTVRIAASRAESVSAVKLRALEALAPGSTAPDALVMKLRGFEVLDEALSLDDVGAVDGSIFLLTNRRRRPVR
jgi:hypothetical protein